MSSRDRNKRVTTVSYGKWKLVLCGALALIAAAVSYRLRGEPGLVASLVGAGFSVVLCVLSHVAMRRVQTVAPRLLTASVFIGVAVSFLAMGGFVAVLAMTRREWLVPATLTALLVYTAYRFVEAFEASRHVREAVPAKAGSVASATKGVGH